VAFRVTIPVTLRASMSALTSSAVKRSLVRFRHHNARKYNTRICPYEVQSARARVHRSLEPSSIAAIALSIADAVGATTFGSFFAMPANETGGLLREDRL
jgi:hypothetical protein